MKLRMRRERAFIAFIVGALIMTSCNKQTVEVPQSNDPVFRVDGTADGAPLTLVAGDSNAFMFTELKEEHGVPVYSGKLSDGNTAIEIEIFDGMIDMPLHSSLNNLPSEFVFARKSSTPLAVLSKDLFPNAAVINTVNWSIDGVSAGTNDVEITDPGVYEVCADILFNDGTSNVLCSELILGYERHANCQIKHFLSQNGTLSAWVVDPQVEIEKIEWRLDNVLVSTDSEISLADLTPYNHILRADVFFVNGVRRTKNMIVDGSLSGKFIDDLTMFETGTLSVLNRDFNVRVKLEEDGVTYSSDLVSNDLNTVIFDEIHYYGKDAIGNTVYKVKAHIVVNVKDVQGVNGTKLLDFQTSFGIAIPKD
jgi:hypothetical protein